MVFDASTYSNLVSARSAAQERLFLQYVGPRDDFDMVIVGSGIGGGVLADDLAERVGGTRRILVVEAGSFIYPTHVYNVCRFPNASLARHYGCDTFWQGGDDSAQFFIGEKPQLNFGGRSIFWSGLIPTLQGWELDFFPDNVKRDLDSGLLNMAGDRMNASRSMGSTAQAIVAALRGSELAHDFSIHETPRALHQPYLTADGVPKDQFFTEPTGVFNTVTGQTRTFHSPTIVLAGGSIESPKLLRRSSLHPALPEPVRALAGRGLTDHPTSNEITAFVTNLGDVPIPKSAHAKIIFYSRGLRDGADGIRYPFNVEMNINHEYWHLRNNDPTDPHRSDPESFSTNDPGGPSRVDIKFSFGNCLDDDNEVKPAPPFGYVPEITFHNQRWMDHLRDSRFPALAGWHKSYDEIFAVLNQVTHRIFSQFQVNGTSARPVDEVWYGQAGKGFGYGTVHHAVGTLRMPYRPSYTAPFDAASVVDEDLRVIGADGVYVCDMSVVPFSSAANPVRTLVALALRLSAHLG